MTGQPGTLEVLAQQAGLALQPLETQLASGNLIAFFASLGMKFPPQLLTQSGFMSAASAAGTETGKLAPLLTKLASDIAAGDDGAIVSDGVALVGQIASVVSALGDIATELKNAAGSLPGLSAADVNAFAEDLAANILGYLVVSYLEKVRPGLAAVGNMVGVLDDLPNPGVAGDPTHPPYTSRRLNFANFGQLLTDPMGLTQTVDGWGSATFNGSLLLPRLSATLGLVGVPATIDAQGALNCFLFSLKANPATTPPGLLGTLTYTIPSGINVNVPVSPTLTISTQI